MLPRHGLEALKVNLKRLQTSDELAKRRHGVQVLDVDQLTTIYRHATDFERLLVVLGLNAAMAQAEIMTLRWDEVEHDATKRMGRKSGVYGEFVLWPETRAALDWWQRVRPARSDLVMVTQLERSYTRQRISNTWKLPTSTRFALAQHAAQAKARRRRLHVMKHDQELDERLGFAGVE